MSDYVLYHNPDRMGHSAEEVDWFNIVTSKHLPAVIGSRVWLLTGDGKPRTYKLIGHFTPTTMVPSEDDDFKWRISGPPTSGVQIRHSRWPVLNRLPWWSAFLKSQANFSLGLQPVTDAEYLEGLEEAFDRATTKR